MLPSLPIISIVMITLGAIPGALARFYLTEWSKRAIGRGFPYGTFFINITGCFLMGAVVALTTAIAHFPVALKLLVATGFLGSYTTFSTYEFDTLTLFRSGKWASTLFYWLGSIGFGVLAVYLGDRLVQSFMA